MKSNLKKAESLLCQLDEAIEIGGFRQWLEEGQGNGAQPLLSVMALGKPTSPLPKSLKVIERVLNEIVTQKLQESTAFGHDAVPCTVCAGRAKLDDDHSDCPACDGEGLVLKGPLVTHEGWLNAASSAYLRLPRAQRLSERRAWCERVEKGAA